MQDSNDDWNVTQAIINDNPKEALHILTSNLLQPYKFSKLIEKAVISQTELQKVLTDLMAKERKQFYINFICNKKILAIIGILIILISYGPEIKNLNQETVKNIIVTAFK